MPKRPSLAETMKQAVQTDEPPLESPLPARSRTEGESRRPATDVPQPVRIIGGAFRAATRAGKKKVTANLDPAAHKQLKGLALERDTTTESLLAEAIRDLFIKHGKPPL